MRGQSFGKSSHNPMTSSMGSAFGTKKSGKMGASGVSFNPLASMTNGSGLNFGASMHQSTVPMNFRGQDKSRDPALGTNPNVNVEDEYISNLQQQIHFMELELKILKEKVVEDEKKSGIGSLFDDEKSSFQHISLLKSKYTKMRRDYDKKIEELNKYKLNVVGEQFVLDSQINVMLHQNLKIEENQKEYDFNTKKRLFELEREFKETSKQRFDLENECRSLENELGRENDDNYNNKMTIIKDREFDDLNNHRFKMEQELNTKLIEDKDKEIALQKEAREKVKQQFEQNAELQKSMKEAIDLREQIDDANVQLELLQIQVKELEDATEMLNDKKEELIEQKKAADLKNEELKKEHAAKEEIAAKRLQAKLNRDKNADVKELIAQEETATQHNQELQVKLEEEKKKYEGLLDEKLEIDERLELTLKSLDHYKDKIKEQLDLIAQLKAQIDGQQKISDDLTAQVEEERKVNRIEEERFRKLAQMNAALKAQLQFIQTKFDYTSNVNVLNTDDFKTLVTSNDMVNLTVKEFVTRLDVVKEEIQKYESLKFDFA
eukprot:403366488